MSRALLLFISNCSGNCCTAAIRRASSMIYRNSPFLACPVSSYQKRLRFRQTVVPPRSHSQRQNSSQKDENDLAPQVQTLCVPDRWLIPSSAREEAEWLRVTLQKWLDDEYCPEETNVEISKVASESYYMSLVEKRSDVGEILLRMARDLESISYEESFHGAFSSANAAVNLIIQRLQLLQA